MVRAPNTRFTLSAMAMVTTPGAIEADPAQMQLLWDTIGQGWGSGNLLELAAPRHADDPRLRTWWRRWERQSATPNAAATLLRWGAEADLRPVLQAVQAPTLFLERAGAGMIDPKSVRAAAALTPHGRYAEIPGDDLLPFLGDPEPMPGEIEEFLTGVRGRVDPDRTLATVLFTDIVGSTQRADSVGDREWRNILDSHHAAVRASLGRFGGVEIDTAGDGFLATFSGPARPVRCGARATSVTPWPTLGLRSGPGCTPARSSTGRIRSPAWRFTSAHASRRWRPRARCSSPASSGPWCSGPACPSPAGARMRSRGCQAPGSCSP